MTDSPVKYPLLQSLESPADLRRLPASKLTELAGELRQFLIQSVSTRGGHFAAGLGTVELTIALHYVFNTPHDRLVWDVGHQAYPHKVLTGRRDRLHTIKQNGGLAPFPARHESEYDTFGVGHSSTSISAALGMAVAAARTGSDRRVVAVIGDGAMTAGMAFEALNHAGSLPADLLVILNDNDMSISENVGALSNHFARVLSGRVYAHLREGGKKVLRQMPTVWELARRSEEHLKGMVLPGTMREGSGLVEFSKRFPDRYFDVAIAEQHAVTFAAGLAAEGLKPVVAIYSTFLQRAYDQLIHDVALQGLPVVFALDRAGLVGSDGATHQGSYDLPYLRCIPNMVIMAPADEHECRQMLYTASAPEGPAMVRYPRGCGPGVAVASELTALGVGKAQLRREAKSGLAVLAFGALVAPAQSIAERLDATFVNMRLVKPLDEDLIVALAARHRALVTIEENVTQGGAGSAVGEVLASEGLQLPLLQLGIPDRFIEHGSREGCLAAAGLDAASLSASVERWWAMQSRERLRSAGGA